MSIGLAACKFMAPSVSNIIGSAILILIGLWVIKDFFLKKDKSDKHMNKGPKREFFFNQLLVKPEKADFDNSGRIDAKESLVLALALSINNFGLGLGASITGLNIYITSAGTFLFSIISVILGYKLGNSGISKFLGKYAALVSGIVIILLGLYEMLV
jgi:putative sporulation protein YtaF